MRAGTILRVLRKSGPKWLKALPAKGSISQKGYRGFEIPPSRHFCVFLGFGSFVRRLALNQKEKALTAKFNP